LADLNLVQSKAYTALIDPEFIKTYVIKDRTFEDLAKSQSTDIQEMLAALFKTNLVQDSQLFRDYAKALLTRIET
jgi:hypothetical protein